MSAPVVTFKKGPSRRPQQSRKRSTPPPEDDATPEPASTVVRPTKKSIANPLVQGSKRRRDADEGDEVGGLDEFDYKADEGISSHTDSFATRSSNYDLEAGGETELAGKKVRLNEDGEIDDGLYRGASGYLPTIKTNPDKSTNKMSARGPIRATANIRSITLMDYQPDVCKPYKDTGFCGYGDSCKFLHDRGDYLAGWQLDKLDPATNQPVQDDGPEEEEVPFACIICRKGFTDPVVTKCGHYFCMKCAVERFVKSPKCYACGAPTSGIFNKAEKIIAKLEAKNKRIREAKGIEEEEEGDGGIEIGGGSDDDEEE